MHLWMLQFWVHHHGNFLFKCNAVIIIQARIQRSGVGHTFLVLLWEKLCFGKNKFWRRNVKLALKTQTQSPGSSSDCKSASQPNSESPGRSWPKPRGFSLSLLHPVCFCGSNKVMNTQKGNKCSLPSKYPQNPEITFKTWKRNSPTKTLRLYSLPQLTHTQFLLLTGVVPIFTYGKANTQPLALQGLQVGVKLQEDL